VKKAQIDTNTLYAWQPTPGLAPLPCRVLSTTAVIRVTHRIGGETTYSLIEGGRPRRDYLETTGYPVAVIHKDTPENRELAMTLTAERVVEEKTLSFGEGGALTAPVEIELVRDFRHVIGDYEAVSCQWEKRLAREREESSRREEHYARMSTRGNQLTARLRELGVQAHVSSYAKGEITISFADLEKLLNMSE